MSDATSPDYHFFPFFKLESTVFHKELKHLLKQHRIFPGPFSFHMVGVRDQLFPLAKCELPKSPWQWFGHLDLSSKLLCSFLQTTKSGERGLKGSQD